MQFRKRIILFTIALVVLFMLIYVNSDHSELNGSHAESFYRPREAKHRETTTVGYYQPRNETSQIKEDISDRTDQRIKVLIHARMRTGSSLTARYLGRHPGFFYAYEPGWMLAHRLPGLRPIDDTYNSLEYLRPYLISLLYGIFHCNFDNHGYFIQYLNKISFFRSYTGLPLKLPISKENITEFCNSKQHTLVKTVRLNNIFSLARILLKDDVKVIHLVRDPRGTALSREQFQRLDKAKSLTRDGIFHPILEHNVKEYCVWMESNYNVVKNGPDWLKKNYLLLRYEDIADYPWLFVPKMYKFLGLPMPYNIVQSIEKEILKRPRNGQAWRRKLTFDQVKKVQELCSERVFKSFGYTMVTSESQLLGNTSLVIDMAKL